MDPRRRRSPARFIAPAALAVVTIAALSIVGGSGGSGGSKTSTPPAAGATTTTTASKTAGTATTRTPSRRRRTYTVRAGDTFGGIANRTGVPVATLQDLNPNVDPSAMTVGQKIRLR